MSEPATRLNLSTRAIAGSEKVLHLIEQKERLDIALCSQDGPLSLDLSKAFLETVFKTVINDRSKDEKTDIDFPPLFKKLKSLLRLSEDNFTNEKLENLGSQIVHSLTELRNRYGAASHGNDGYHKAPIEWCNIEFIASAVDGLASCIYSRHRETLHPAHAQRLQYSDYLEFNDWLDEQFPSYSLSLGNDATISLTASEIIFKQDINSYREMLVQYNSTEDEDRELDPL